MTTAEMFSDALNLKDEWKITYLDLLEDPIEKNRALHIYIEYVSEDEEKCSICGEDLELIRYRTKNWRHLDFFQMNSYIHARFPKLNCKNHGDKIIDFPWEKVERPFFPL